MTRSKTPHLLTGATGFVGSCLLIELLLETQANVICLVRDQDGSPRIRLRNLIEKLISLYQLNTSVLKEFDERCQVVRGDILESVDALYKRITSCAPSGIDQVWHTAASLNYEERFSDEIYALNKGGVETIAELSQRLNANVLNHFSTAYVAGTNTGKILEHYSPDPHFNANTYERTKSLGEHVIENIRGMHTRTFRPSIVVGHSETQGAINFSGLYGFVRRLHQFKKIMGRINRGYLDNNPVRIVADGDAQLNLVHVNRVAAQAIRVSLSDSQARYFHLTSAESPTVRQALNAVFTKLGLPAPEIISEASAMNWIDKQFNEKIEFYTSYLNSAKRFDRTNIDRAIKSEWLPSHHLSSKHLDSLLDWYIAREIDALPTTVGI